MIINCKIHPNKKKETQIEYGNSSYLIRKNYDHTDERNSRGVVLQIIYKIELFPWRNRTRRLGCWWSKAIGITKATEQFHAWKTIEPL